MEFENMVKIIEVSKIHPSISNSLPLTFSLPLTDFDWHYLNFPLVQRLFFYSLPNNLCSNFESIIIPNLKLSLSLTLQHFFPLAGALVWPDSSPLPFILYSRNDAVSFTQAESLVDFHSLSSSHPAQLHHSRSLLPLFHSHSHSHSHSRFPIPMCAIQVTNFPNHGYSIGFSIHHVINDGQSFSLFLKSWAHICNKLNHLEPSPNLPHELIPSFERNTNNMISNPLEYVPNDKNSSNVSISTPPFDWERATFDLTPNHIGKLKRRAMEYWTKTNDTKQEDLHLSTFVVVYTHALVCVAKAKGEECKENFIVTLVADVRSLLFPPISTNYFGNCVVARGVLVEARELREEENGFSMVAKRIGDLILELKASGGVEKPKPFKGEFKHGEQFELCTIGSSPKYKFYETNFGWGNPKQVEMLPMGYNNLLLMDSRHGDGGVQLGLTLPTHQMNVFASLFHKDLL